MNTLNIGHILYNAMERIYDLGSLASVGFGSYRLGQISDAVASPSAQVVSAIGTLKSIGLALTILFLALLAIVLAKVRALNTPVAGQAESSSGGQPVPVAGGWMAARWGEITRHMDSAKEAEWKFAVIEADKLMDEVLRRGGYPGDTLGERLANIQPGQFQDLQGLWDAHKIRNRIAHSIDYFLRYTEAKHAIEAYARAMKELGAL